MFFYKKSSSYRGTPFKFHGTPFGKHCDRGTPPTSSDNLLVVASSSTGLLDEFLNEIRTEIELHFQDLTSSDSSSDNEEIECWYLPRFDTASEIRAVSTRYFGQESESDLVTAVMIYESMESLDEPPPTTSYRVVHLTAEPLTSDEEEGTLVVTTAMDEAAGSETRRSIPYPNRCPKSEDLGCRHWRERF